MFIDRACALGREPRVRALGPITLDAADPSTVNRATRSEIGADPLSGHVFLFLNRRRWCIERPDASGKRPAVGVVAMTNHRKRTPLHRFA